MPFSVIRHSLILKMLLSGGLVLLLCVALWIGFNVLFFKENVLRNVKSDIAMLSDTILLGLHYAMMLDSENDIKEIINNIGKQEDIESIRIYNKQGRIVFSNIKNEVNNVVDMRSPSCWTCHKFDPPPDAMTLDERSRMRQVNGNQLVGIMTPIPNEEGCIGGPCHVHSEDERLLGLLDIEVSTKAKSAMIVDFERNNLIISIMVFLATFAALFIYSYRAIFMPIRRLIRATRNMGAGSSFSEIRMNQADEIGMLADAFNKMGRTVSEKHRELVEQREEYRDLFQNVPCLVSVVDRDFRVIRHNKAYRDHFGHSRGKHCYQMNKGRLERCEVCPVDRTFLDGLPHTSEETGRSKDGHIIHWIVYTSPIRNKDGEITAAMEMMIDITRRKELEEKLAASEERYQAIFESTPNALFVLDADTLDILNCNDSASASYGYSSEELIGRSFLALFREEERDDWRDILKTRREVDQCSHMTRDGRTIYVSIRISPAEFQNQKVLVASCADVTKKLEAEQQLIQASKMTTLGEMATGVAHELNQPLAILKTISSLLSRRISRKQEMDEKMLAEIAEGVNTHVDRASKIIEHMREFGRKSDLKTMPVNMNNVLQRAFDFFSQQLNVRNIRVEWRLQEDLPLVMAESNRLEQVIINLLINARDAIEERWKQENPIGLERRITIVTTATDKDVVVKVCDTGSGIPETIRTKLFEPFFTTKDVGKGTGLGLSISYGIIQDYGGAIEAVPTNGEGACFVITLPIAPGIEESNH
ncbi:PAS domain-containing sensor histidine kinase [Oceanidesulfovibrio indonesiensis]|uniref:histidine kinase n=1 Tax=Oceanidesulfovibrio indonesiensis TaxID=54767 RepID=A0A7M3MG53_9BACT|nr:PAS domain S-box protein [Oceanidesulfovibrio indonesiensis]TVM18298.1 PAS domain-containing sensor histidine kinase [Oceanidesulfovibrio indonesiensis]